MSEEQIIERKLILDGEGTGDDRRLNYFQKLVAKWILTEDSSPEEIKRIYNKILLQLSLIEHSRRRSAFIERGNNRQLKQYEDYQMEVANKITSITDTINISKIVLAKAKCEKSHNLNCDLIARDIAELPSRTETSKTVQQLESDISRMKEIQRKLENELKHYRKHFILLSATANQLYAEVKESEFADG